MSRCVRSIVSVTRLKSGAVRSSSRAIISVWIDPRTISPPRTCSDLGSQPIYASLQVRAELFIALAVEVLELVKDEDVTALGHRLEQLRKLKEVGGPRIPVGWDLERLKGVVHRREHACGYGIGHLGVEDGLPAADFLHRPLDERRLADSTTAGDLGEEPPPPVKHSLQVRELFSATVELPVRHSVPIR